jgi:hypothetical protein
MGLEGKPGTPPMMKQEDAIDMEKALSDPSAVFAQPDDILRDRRLSSEQKLRLLRQWERDAMGLTIAEGEGMGGGEESRLARVRSALRSLDPSVAKEGDPPTKRSG